MLIFCLIWVAEGLVIKTVCVGGRVTQRATKFRLKDA